MSHHADWGDAGVFLLQHHDDSVKIDQRFMLVGARAGKDESGEALYISIDTEEDKGTVGDIHPWRYWPMEDRKSRGMGSWSMAYAAIATGGGGSGPVSGGSGPSTGYRGPGDQISPGTRTVPGGEKDNSEGDAAVVSALPIRTKNYDPDTRYKVIDHKMPEGWPEVPEGTLCIALAGTEEFEQENILIPVDNRLIAPNWRGPSKMGTRVYDLDPEGKISKDRWARLQSAWRVVLFPEQITGLAKDPGYGLAWQLGPSGQGTLAGYGACYGRVDAGGGGKSGQNSPTVTPSENPNQGHGAVSGGGHWGIGAGGVGPGNVPGAGYTDSQQGPPGGG